MTAQIISLAAERIKRRERTQLGYDAWMQLWFWWLP